MSSKYRIRRGDSCFYAFGLHHQLIQTDPIQSIKDGSVAWYVHYDGAVVGYGTARKVSQNVVYLNSSGILPKHRGQGLQLRLLRTRIAYARSEGAKVVITYTSHDNSASINNLIRCGFRAYVPEHEYAGKGWCYWRLLLDK